jgi:hypothetical protein
MGECERARLMDGSAQEGGSKGWDSWESVRGWEQGGLESARGREQGWESARGRSKGWESARG